MITPSNGFILLIPQDTDDFFTLPDQTGQLRTGIVLKNGGTLIHASGKELESPVKEGDTIIFQYLDNHSYKHNNENYYLIQFNMVCGTIK